MHVTWKSLIVYVPREVLISFDFWKENIHIFKSKQLSDTTGVYGSVQYELNSKKYQQLQMFLLRESPSSFISQSCIV